MRWNQGNKRFRTQGENRPSTRKNGFTQTDTNLLINLGVDYVQGYLLHRPSPINDLIGYQIHLNGSLRGISSIFCCWIDMPATCLGLSAAFPEITPFGFTLGLEPITDSCIQ